MVVALGTAVGQKLSAMTLALAGCAVGRGLDLATTWVALQAGRAQEAQPVAAGVINWWGGPAGLIFYEAFVTTPIIFLGLYLVARLVRDDQARAQRVLFLFVGVVSACAALHNAQFVF